MYTGVYYPKDPQNMHGTDKNNVCWIKGNMTGIVNGLSYVERPSYCVRLIVFEMPDD